MPDSKNLDLGYGSRPQPLNEGYVRKGGTNPPPPAQAQRPPDPAPIRRPTQTKG